MQGIRRRTTSSTCSATDRGLCFLEFGSSAEDLLLSLREEFPSSTLIAMEKPYSAQFTGWMQALTGYLRNHREDRRAVQTMPLSLHGTAFQLKVRSYLQTSSAGSTQTYSEVAQAIDRPRAVRAVASACAANRVAIVVPCHRVIRGDGGLGGYRWGLDRKRSLLDAEKQAQKATA